MAVMANVYCLVANSNLTLCGRFVSTNGNLKNGDVLVFSLYYIVDVIPFTNSLNGCFISRDKVNHKRQTFVGDGFFSKIGLY